MISNHGGNFFFFSYVVSWLRPFSGSDLPLGHQYNWSCLSTSIQGWRKLFEIGCAIYIYKLLEKFGNFQIMKFWKKWRFYKEPSWIKNLLLWRWPLESTTWQNKNENIIWTELLPWLLVGRADWALWNKILSKNSNLQLGLYWFQPNLGRRSGRLLLCRWRRCRSLWSSNSDTLYYALCPTTWPIRGILLFFQDQENHPKNFCGQGKGLTGHLQETGTRGSRYQLLVNRSHRGREFVFPASLELVSLPGPEAGVELLVELAPLLMLGEDTSREYEGAGLALRTRDPPEC